MSSLGTPARLEALLFYKAEPVSVKAAAEILGVDEAAVYQAAEEINADGRRGTVVAMEGPNLALATHPAAHDVADAVAAEETRGQLTKSAVETLAVIVYRGPVAKTEIDYIRGVNSQFILRNLLVRGLILRIPNPKDNRGYLYRPSLALLAHLGVREAREMPEYDEYRAEIEDAVSTAAREADADVDAAVDRDDMGAGEGGEDNVNAS